MGSCCFTPRKYNFLWWYWLLLASIIGIPMLLAALYMQREKRKIEATPDDAVPVADRLQKAGKKAARVFWECTFFFAIAGMVVGDALAGRFYSSDVVEHALQTQYLLIWEFFFCLILTHFGTAWSRKRKSLSGKIAVFAAALLLWIILNPVGRLSFFPFDIPALLLCGSPDVIRPFVSTLTFVCGWFAMHYWRNFLDQPTRRNIWRSLGALMVAAFLYYGAERYGNLIHYQIHEIARFRIPDQIIARNYMTEDPYVSHQAPSKDPIIRGKGQ